MNSFSSWIWAALSVVTVVGLNLFYWSQFNKVRRSPSDTVLGMARGNFLGASVAVVLVSLLSIFLIGAWAWSGFR